MSYILDALKKSDQERKRGDVPTLQTVHIPVSVEQKKPWSLYGFIALLLLLLSFVIGMVVSEREQVTVIERNDIAIKPVEIESEITQKVVNNPVKVEKNPQEKEPAIVKAKEVADVKSVDKKPSKILQKTDSAADFPSELVDIPYLHELPEYVQQSIPDLSFAGHVYSSNARNRSVIINGNLMSEGDNIIQGLDVEKITPSGVVFRYQETFFRVDILQDWSFE